ncbi:toll-like receptor 13 [Protopterus annectens]|uniref:toll-like receptor 13 n=1 Tax=Protopterus annectens TaxID=7888 RepID=UPI001CFA41EF|nr:toll-like receptor 13 [Protopterus annectens]XP_043935661.1 toll-like receptor 13 [Protopterus annectens]XP_043935669.1 toll-like receptor 13 [Protopterus annectens]
MKRCANIWSLLATLVFSALLCHHNVSSYSFPQCSVFYKDSRRVDCVGKSISSASKAVEPLKSDTKWLNLSQNLIAVLQPGSFQRLPSLLELRLDNNQIHSLMEGAFRNLTSLFILNLNGNQITSLGASDFEGLPNLQYLSICKNKIMSIHQKAFFNLINLKKLYLSSNKISDFWNVSQAIVDLLNCTHVDFSLNNISTLVKEGDQVTLNFLKSLNLFSNNLTIFDFTSYLLPELQYLNISKNNMKEIQIRSFQNMPSLTTIVFDFNPLNISQLYESQLGNLSTLHWSVMEPSFGKTVNEACRLFRTLPKLRHLVAFHAKVNTAALNQIAECSNLSSINLYMTHIPTMTNKELSNFINLEELSLEKCKLKEVSKTAWPTTGKLHTLKLASNNIKLLDDDLFTPLTNLAYLDLSKNHLTYINGLAFYAVRNLTTLILRDCQIAAVGKNSFKFPQTLTYLDISYNSLTVVKHQSFYKLRKLETLLLSGNKILSINLQGFDGLIRLKYLSLADNNLYKISNKTFKPLKSLVTLDLSQNSFAFDYKHQSSQPFIHLCNLTQLDLSQQIPKTHGSPPSQLLWGLHNLKVLNLQKNSDTFFQHISLEPLTNLEVLDMSSIVSSKLTLTLKPEFFRCLNKLHYLILDKNNIEDLPSNIFSGLQSLRSISLKNNLLGNISKELLSNVSALRYLDLYLNPVSCSCQNEWFQNMSLHSEQVFVPYIENYTCSRESETEILFKDLDLSFCKIDIGMIAFLIAFPITLMTIVSSLVYGQLSWTLRFMFYMLRAWILGKIQKADKSWKYDAYVSYSSQDEYWVMHKLLPNLEEEGIQKYKLCFKPRDFIPGTYLIDNIENAVKNSRKTICVITNSYLECDWCTVEMQLACCRVLFDQEDVLILVFLQNIPSYRLSHYHRLRKRIKKKTYITWTEERTGEQLFWAKLRDALRTESTNKDEMQLLITE